jgi:hypothetical protein
LRPPCGRHVGDRALDDLEEGLLDALARYVAGDGDVLALAGDLVDLVDVDDAALGGADIAPGVLDELEEDVLDVLADVARLGEGGGVGHGEGDFELLGEGLGEEGLARARGPMRRTFDFSISTSDLASLAWAMRL